MVIFVGDLHGSFEFFHGAMEKFDHDIPMIFIQVGDFGYWPNSMDKYPDNFPWKVYFIAGNHDYYPWLMNITEVTEIKHNLFYVPRGIVMDIDGITMGFMGGAESVDKAWRTLGRDWFHEERVTRDDVEKLASKKVEVLVTHAPPKSVISAHFPPINKSHWGLPDSWIDDSAVRINELWVRMGKPFLICGHMHKSVVGDGYRILDINEAWGYTPIGSP